MSDDKSNTVTFINMLASIGQELLDKEQARRDSLSPEQRAHEDQQKQQRLDAHASAKLAKQFAQYQGAFSEWAKCDLWTPEEYACLLQGAEPSAWPSEAIKKTATIIRRCLGQSLPNTSSDPKKPTLPRQACLDWWKGRIDPHPFWLRALDGITHALNQPKTAKATAVRKNTKALRHQWLAWFLNEMDKRATRYSWDRSCIPVTKKDFRDVFLQACPAVQEFAPATLDKELPVFHAKCRHGVKHNDNNVLTTLFAAEIQTNKQR